MTAVTILEPLCALVHIAFIMNFRELHCILHPTMDILRQSTFCLKEKQTRQLWISMAETVFTWQSGPTTSNIATINSGYRCTLLLGAYYLSGTSFLPGAQHH